MYCFCYNDYETRTNGFYGFQTYDELIEFMVSHPLDCNIHFSCYCIPDRGKFGGEFISDDEVQMYIEL